MCSHALERVLELEGELSELVEGRGSLFFLTGEPGIGKTRLADELTRSAAARGVSVHWGRAWEAGGAPSYWPFTQALRGMTDVPDAPELEALVAPARTPIERFQLFEAIDAFLRRASAMKPRLLILDDLHAADPSSLSLLHFIARDLRLRALMIVGTYRDAEARLFSEIGTFLRQIDREGARIQLRRLDRAEVATYVTLATGAEPAEDRLEAIYRQTEGNPLFLRELLQCPFRQSSDGIAEVVRARLSLLPDASRRALESASILGREFGIASLAALAEMTELDIRAAIEPAANAGIVEPIDHPPRWRFTHVLLLDGLRSALAA